MVGRLENKARGGCVIGTGEGGGRGGEGRRGKICAQGGGINREPSNPAWRLRSMALTNVHSDGMSCFFWPGSG